MTYRNTLRIMELIDENKRLQSLLTKTLIKMVKLNKEKNVLELRELKVK